MGYKEKGKRLSLQSYRTALRYGVTRYGEMGERLVKLRGNRKARRVADEMGISRQSLWLYETGQLMPRESIKRLIADYYGVSIPALFYGEGQI